MRGIDVAVLGGGPAGIAIASGLARLGHRVVVFERSRYEGPRFGETLGPEIQPLLAGIPGAWDQFLATPRIPFRTTYSAWGGPELSERSSITHPLGEGWHVDRAAVDRALADAAAASGIPVHMGAGFCTLQATDDGLQITPASSSMPSVTARFLVDASGRGAPATASALPDQREWIKADRLIAASVRFAASSSAQVPPEGELLLESAEAGWWYSVPQPDGALLVTFMTDADLLPSGGRAAIEPAWRKALAKTLYTSARTRGYGPECDTVRTVRADSGFLSCERGNGWMAVGDAAMAWDPLSGSGFARALRSGLEAVEAVDRALSSGSKPAVVVPATPRARERFETYLQRKLQYYSAESRWPDSPFWARRRSV